MCTKLQLYLARQLCVAGGFAMAGICFLVFPAVTVTAVHKVGVAGIGALLSFIPMVALELLPYVVPMSFLLGVVAVYGRLAADHEWTAVRMAGIDPVQLLMPGLALAGLLSMATGWAAHELAPEWKWRQKDFRSHVRLTLNSLPPGQTELWLGDFYLHALRRDGDSFERVLVFLPEAMDGSDVKVVAERATFSFFPEHLEVVFQGARVVKDAEESWSENLILRPRFDALFNSGERPRHRAKYWPTSELRAHLAAGKPTERVEAYEYEIHRRHAVSWTYVLFLLVGMPIGVRLRRGSQLAAFAVATAIALFYYALSMRLGKELAYQGSVPAWLGAWAVNLLGGAMGLWMSWTELRR